MIPAGQAIIRSGALAAELGVAPSTLTKWSKTKLRAARFGRGIWLVQKLRDLAVLPTVVGLALACTACASPRTLNSGAPFRVTMTPMAQTSADSTGAIIAGWHSVAWVGLDSGMRLSSDRTKPELVADTMHETAELIVLRYPELYAQVWETINAMDAPGFRCGSDALYYERAAAAEAKRASEAK